MGTQATINFGKVQMGVVNALNAPITKPHCKACGMPFNLRSNADGTWTCKRCREKEGEKMRTQNYNGYTYEQLRAVFDAIKDPTDWRAPICVAVKGDSVLAVVAAIEYFTATTPTIRLNTRTMDYIIESVGYRNGPAGDN